jgi:hypothetical protein
LDDLLSSLPIHLQGVFWPLLTANLNGAWLLVALAVEQGHSAMPGQHVVPGAFDEVGEGKRLRIPTNNCTT